jgi:hypothetical protein
MADALPKHVAEAIDENALPVRKYKRGRFIPISKRQLAELLLEHVAPDARAAEQYREVCRLLEQVIHAEYRARAVRLKENYAWFDCDSDVVPPTRLTAEEFDARSTAVFADVIYLLEKANFRVLPRGDVDAAVSALSPWGLNLHIDLNAFDRLEVYARGDKIDHRVRRSWRSFFRLKHYRVPLYQRLMIMFRPHGDILATSGYGRNRIYLKLFKNIPEGDVDMVLPGTKVRMTMLDRGKIAFPLVSGIVVTTWKIIKGALLVAAVGVYGLFAYLVLIVGTVGYGWRSFFGYKRTKEKYQLNLTQNLYYQKLDGDLGAILRLIDEAEDQEFREALTAWFLLWRLGPHDGWSLPELDRSAEQLLQAELKRDVDFDVEDALDKMIRWGIVDVQADGKIAARSPEATIAALRRSIEKA